MVDVAYGACVGSWEKMNRFVLPGLASKSTSLYTMCGQASIATAYNHILDAHTRQDIDALILLHDDLEILDPEAEAKLQLALSEPDVALAGVAGGSGQAGLAWWNVSPIGHQQTDVMNIDFGVRAGDVEILEGSLLAFSPWAIKNLRFDTRFAGFHSYDEIGMQAISVGKRCVVVDVDTHHHSVMGFKSDASRQQWEAGNELYKQKWGLE